MASVTVAAIIVAPSAEAALADTEGVAAVRRLADVAWSGGAMPIVVVGSAAGDDTVARTLAGSPVTLVGAAVAESPDLSASIVRGAEIAAGMVSETDAWLIWPVAMVWVGPETVTSLIEAHGTFPDSVLRPTFDGVAGWPILVPAASLDAIRARPGQGNPDDLIAGAFGPGDVRELGLGDPGSTHDVRTPRSSLPAYVGPPEPAAGHTHEWGAAVADRDDDAPLREPHRAS